MKCLKSTALFQSFLVHLKLGYCHLVLKHKYFFSFKNTHRASLVAQWLRVCLLMQETRVRALVWEDPTCRGAAGPVSHDC